jgi:hypothetical protein
MCLTILYLGHIQVRDLPIPSCRQSSGACTKSLGTGPDITDNLGLLTAILSRSNQPDIVDVNRSRTAHRGHAGHSAQTNPERVYVAQVDALIGEGA